MIIPINAHSEVGGGGSSGRRGHLQIMHTTVTSLFTRGAKCLCLDFSWL